MTNDEMLKATSGRDTDAEDHLDPLLMCYDPLKEIDDLIKNTFPEKERTDYPLNEERETYHE